MCIRDSYGGDMGRYANWVYTMYSSTVSRYGLPFLNAAVPNQDIFDYPYTNGYTDVVPYYLDWEQAWGITGTNENPFMPMAGNFPMPPSPLTPCLLYTSGATSAR